MIQFKRVIGVCLIVSALVPTMMAQAATYYVATTGSNSNPGTSPKPWRTIAYATSRMVAGDTTYVQGGIYNEGVIRFRRSGTQSAPIKLLNAPGAFPVINFMNRNQLHRIHIQQDSSYQQSIGWIMIEGFEIRNGYDGIKIYNGSDLTIRRNWIHHNGPSQGILGNGTRVLIDRNRINHNGNFDGCASTTPACFLDHGIYMNGTAITITNNLIYDNLSYGIQANGNVHYDPSRHAGPEYALSHNWIIANNTIAYNLYRGAIAVWGFSLTNLRIENNIFYENAVKLPTHTSQGIDFSAMKSTGISIRNNLAYASGSGGTNFLSGGATQGVHYTVSDNIVNTANPGFVNAPAALWVSPNFALKAGSLAINKGASLAVAKVAYNGTVRPQLSYFDIGAYEYNSSPSPPTPIGLRVN